jgi:hypothetical protein
MKIRILETCTREELNITEDKWIKTLNTCHPFGLNDRITGCGDLTRFNDPADIRQNPYLVVKTQRRKRSHGVRRRKTKGISVDVIQELTKMQQNHETLNKYIVFLKAQNKRTLQTARSILDNDKSIPGNLRIIALSFLCGYFSNNKKENKEETKDRIMVGCKFESKLIDDIKVSSIFTDRSVKAALPKKDNMAEGKPLVYFTYDVPVSQKICNHSKILRNLQQKELKEILKIPCECQGSEYCYAPAGHIITGNLNIIADEKLRKIMQKGAKYRLPVSDNKDHIILAVLECARNFADKHSRKYGFQRENYVHWLSEIERVCRLRLRKIFNNKKLEIIEFDLDSAINKLHRKYVIVPADKSANNMVIICKKMYLTTIAQELGYDPLTGECKGNEVYEYVGASKTDILYRHSSLLKRYGYTMEEEDNTLPKIFAIPKLHKNPYKFRFIAGARKSSIKQINVLLFRVLSFFQKHLSNYCRVLGSRGVPNAFWSIDNSLDIIGTLKRINEIKDIRAFDFSNMFTALQHRHIYDNLFALVDLCFNNSKKQYLSTTEKKIFWSNDKQTSSLDIHDVKQLIVDIISNTYVEFAEYLFRQVKGTPMGGNASPLVASLTLSMMEFKYCTSKEGKPIVSKFGLCRRYIDDALFVNIGDFNPQTIYPADLELSATDTKNNGIAYLDLLIHTTNTIQISAYDKTDDFPFEVVKFGYKSSNVSSRLGPSVLFSQTIRFARICTEKDQFVNRVRKAYQIMVQHGYEEETLYETLLKFCEKYEQLLWKYKCFSKNDKLQLVNFCTT